MLCRDERRGLTLPVGRELHERELEPSHYEELPPSHTTESKLSTAKETELSKAPPNTYESLAFENESFRANEDAVNQGAEENDTVKLDLTVEPDHVLEQDPTAEQDHNVEQDLTSKQVDSTTELDKSEDSSEDKIEEKMDLSTL